MLLKRMPEFSIKITVNTSICIDMPSDVKDMLVF